MSVPATPLPVRRPDLLIRPFGEDGQYAVKDPHSGEFFHVGEQEHFLLTQLDGERSGATIRAVFEERFGQPLSEEELHEFLVLAAEQGLVSANGPTSRGRKPSDARSSQGVDAHLSPGRRQSILYWRKNIFDPDRLFTWLAPKLWFFWTRGFLVFSAGSILLAAVLLWSNRQELAGSVTNALPWQTAIWAWLALLAVTTLHESAHGLTCKRYGGEVHEIGFLLLFFMPCFYCNISDAWMFKEKSKRLWVTFAGGYFELFVWALAVVAWRLTLPGTLPHYLAFVVASVCGVQTLFNLNPLLKLDGYYLLSDWLEVPNLQQRASGYLKGHVRWLLWGAARPFNETRGRLLLAYGLFSWSYSVAFLTLILAALWRSIGTRWGWLGMGVIGFLGYVSVRRLFREVCAGEVINMIRFRHKRALLWTLLFGGSVAVLCLVEIEDRESGAFQIHAAARAELRAPVAGFLRTTHYDEGDWVASGAVVVQIEAPDLTTRMAQKQAEVREAQAKVRLLEAGPRSEEIAEQRGRVERASDWHALAQQDLIRTARSLKEEIARLDKQIVAARAEVEAAQDGFERARILRSRNAGSDEQYREAERKLRVCHAQLAQAESAKRSQEAKGNIEAETEVARRAKELADAEAVLRLMTYGTRPEEIDAERARLSRLQEELAYLRQVEQRGSIHCPISGFLCTPRLKEKMGQYFREGVLICLVEDPASFEAEITLAEQDVARIQNGQTLSLRPRTLPFETFDAQVDRIAPTAERGEGHGTVAVYCRPEGASDKLRPGMTGYARIFTGRRPVGAILVERGRRLVRQEFWW
jgi:multidrug efflux pump subunit AcrA (membrane-fusion protein)